MIITVTLNPALDRTLEIEQWKPGEALEAKLLERLPAGKGINVAIGLAHFVEGVVALGLVGRTERPFFKQYLKEMGVDECLTPVAGMTRENVSIIDRSIGRETHLREAGFDVSESEWEAFRHTLELQLHKALTWREARKSGEKAQKPIYVLFSGSLPRGVDPEGLVCLIEVCKEHGILPVVDTHGESLRLAVEAGVHSVKVNQRELTELLGEKEGARRRPDRMACRLAERVPLVLVTAGANGAYMTDGERAAHASCRVPKKQVVNTVGCGDALMAGFFGALMGGSELAEALRWGVAAGASCARSVTASGYTRADVEAAFQQVKLKEYKSRANG